MPGCQIELPQTVFTKPLCSLIHLTGATLQAVISHCRPLAASHTSLAQS